MNVEIRKTSQGTEYWDTEEKRTRLVPTGSEPSFEVDESPKSIITGVDLAKGEDKTVINDYVVDDQTEITEISLDEMDADQLREFAKQNEIELPFNVKKEETIRKYIEEALVVDGE